MSAPGRPMTRLGAIAALLLGLCAAAQASEPPSAVAERKQIQQDRAAAEARYKQAEAECQTRFAVSGCIADAQAQRRTELTELRQRELALDEAKRRAEVEDNARRVQTKQAEAAARPVPVPQAASAPQPASAASAAARRERNPVSKTADDATAAAARVAAQQRRANEAAAHRQEVEQRNAERAARGKKSTPLPVPSAASVADSASAAR